MLPNLIETIDTSTGPNFFQRHPAIGSKIIKVGGMVFALMYGNEQRLGRIGVRYMKDGPKKGPREGIIIADEARLQVDIQRLKVAGRGIIIGNHHSSKFPDYLPIFGCIGDDILQKTLFFTGPYNLEMNRQQFPGYRFEPAVERGRNEMLALNELLRKRLQEMKDQGGYIFLLPAGPGIDTLDKPFQALFGQILRGLISEEMGEPSLPKIPVLTFHVEHSEPLSYAKILLKRIGLTSYTTKIQGVLTEASDWPKRGGVEQRVFYNRLFKKSP